MCVCPIDQNAIGFLSCKLKHFLTVMDFEKKQKNGVRGGRVVRKVYKVPFYGFEPLLLHFRLCNSTTECTYIRTYTIPWCTH